MKDSNFNRPMLLHYCAKYPFLASLLCRAANRVFCAIREQHRFVKKITGLPYTWHNIPFLENIHTKESIETILYWIDFCPVIGICDRICKFNNNKIFFDDLPVLSLEKTCLLLPFNRTSERLKSNRSQLSFKVRAKTFILTLVPQKHMSIPVLSIISLS